MSSNSDIHSSTIDPEEALYYNGASSIWWDKNGINKILHHLNEFLFEFYRQTIDKQCVDLSSSFKDLKILDIGCGGGIMAEAFAKLGATVVGIDINPHLIDVARQHASLDSSITDLTYFLETVEDHALNNSEKYDVVVVNLVIHHLCNKELFLEACIKCLKPEGSIYVSALSQTYIAWLLYVFVCENILKVIDKGVHHWRNLIVCDKIKEILKENKCMPEEIRGLFHNPFTDSLYWIKSTSFVYAIHAKKATE